jgi:predicted amidophosphoribosyltransferase
VAEIHPVQIRGKWAEGYVLDNHTMRSEFIGHDEFGNPKFETQRTELGELLFRLKYRNDESVLPELIGAVAGFMQARRVKPDLLIPTPPSRRLRRVQPVQSIVRGLSQRMKVPWAPVMRKKSVTPELKNIHDYHERMAILESAFTVDASIVQGKTVLVVDDLYRSGATLNAIAEILYKEGRVKWVVVVALTRTRIRQ